MAAGPSAALTPRLSSPPQAQALYRQAQMMAWQGVIIERSTLSFWRGYAAAEIAPVVARLREMLLASTRIFADETVVPVLDPGRGRTKQGYFWATLAKVPPAQRVECQRRALRVTIARGAAALRRRWSQLCARPGAYPRQHATGRLPRYPAVRRLRRLQKARWLQVRPD